MGSCLYVVLSNPVEGEDEAYNDWYTKVHIRDVMKIPGIISAQRFRLAPVQRYDPPYAWRYLAVYEVDDSDLETPMAMLKSLSGTKAMPVSKSFDPAHIGLLFEPVCNKLEPNKRSSRGSITQPH